MANRTLEISLERDETVEEAASALVAGLTVQFQVYPGKGFQGHPEVCFTGSEQELEKLMRRYDGEASNPENLKAGDELVFHVRVGLGDGPDRLTPEAIAENIQNTFAGSGHHLIGIKVARDIPITEYTYPR